jgi:hypothetical protein
MAAVGLVALSVTLAVRLNAERHGLTTDGAIIAAVTLYTGPMFLVAGLCLAVLAHFQGSRHKPAFVWAGAIANMALLIVAAIGWIVWLLTRQGG